MPLTYREPSSADGLYFNFLLFGPPKTGKSAGAASAPPAVSFLNLDLPNATHYAHARYGKRVREIVYEGSNTLVDLVLAANSGDFTTVVIDPVHELYRFLLDEYTSKQKRPSLNQRGDAAVYIENFARALCAAPCHTVFVCHELQVETMDTAGQKLTERWPYTGTSTPTLGQKIAGFVDVVGYTGTTVDDDGQTHYLAQLVSGQGRQAGDRWAALGSVRPIDVTEWIETMQSVKIESADSAEKE